MGDREQVNPEENLEESAITGGVPAAAEPPPFTRGRRSSAAASVWIYVLGGIALLLAALLAEIESGRAVGVAAAGVGLLIVGVFSITGLLDAVTRAILGFGAGALLAILAFTGSEFGYADLIMLVVGAACFIASFASLAASRRLGSGAGDDEPGAGVANV